MPTGPKDSQKPAASRQERLAQALRDNLKKRKAQQRAQAQKRKAGGDGSGDDSQP